MKPLNQGNTMQDALGPWGKKGLGASKALASKTCKEGLGRERPWPQRHARRASVKGLGLKDMRERPWARRASRQDLGRCEYLF
eukprot:1147331-Pelagomonas_calceolata.AAC.5